MNFTFREFWAGCVEYFSRFFKLLLIGIVMIFAILIFYLLISGLVDIMTENTLTEFWPFVLFGLKLVLLAAVLAWIDLALGYTKIRIVVHDTRGVYQALKQALGFVSKNFAGTAILYILLVITGFVLLLSYLVIEGMVPKDTATGVLIFFIVAQLYIVSRVWLRLGFYCGQLKYYRQN